MKPRQPIKNLRSASRVETVAPLHQEGLAGHPRLTRLQRYLLDQVAILQPSGKTRAGPLSARRIHDLRVATRRLQVGFEFFSSLFSKSDAAPVVRRLSELRHALGEVRALDVHADLLQKARSALPEPAREASDSLCRQLESNRRALEAAAHERLEGLRRAEFALLLENLLLWRNRPLDSKHLSREAALELDRFRGEVRHRYRLFNRKGSRTAFHRLRVATKKFRYALETVQAAFSVDLKPRIRQVKKVQDLMGKIHDEEVLIRFLKETRKQEAGSPRLGREGLGPLLHHFRNQTGKRFESFQWFLSRARPWSKKIALKHCHD